MKTYSQFLEQTSVADKQRLETERRKAILDQQATDREQERDTQLKAEQEEREADSRAAQKEREEATLRQKLQRLEQQ
jgi:hypothetical protein